MNSGDLITAVRVSIQKHEEKKSDIHGFFFFSQTDLVNQSLYNFTHADERMRIYTLLSQHRVVPGDGVPDYEKGGCDRTLVRSF